ncbi:MAG: hypothetical protein KKF16_00035 [Euryarchaeota archaeon]|nr:hypothetical protein [Euryarchaeota archaeon]MBU4547250.1 hypothetical protein [Euryarchaeota archaeon]MBU4607804.1 hypothetical protein [Euryarchaeota archaeon]MBV1755159.1 hypothetical protein [Methanobacterium sp.]MBV1768372.1 hypothetical protein [Methanobacterium sp.]
MSYLICDRCGGYYELQGDESPEDPQNLRFRDSGNKVPYSFPDKCECGGKLKYYDNIGALLED